MTDNLEKTSAPHASFLSLHCFWIVFWNSKLRTGHTSNALFLDDWLNFATELQNKPLDLKSNCTLSNLRLLFGLHGVNVPVSVLLLGLVKYLMHWIWTRSLGLTLTGVKWLELTLSIPVQPLGPSLTVNSPS